MNQQNIKAQYAASNQQSIDCIATAIGKIPSEESRIYAVISGLEETVLQLEAKLHSVLSVYPQDGDSQSAYPEAPRTNSPLAHSLEDIADRLQKLNRVIQSITDRVEL